MDETLHVNEELHKTDTHYINVVKTRLWPQLLASLNWIIKSPIPNKVTVQNGLGLIIINNLAIIIEGFITDIIVEHLDNHELEKSKQINELVKKGWADKRELYKNTFQKSIETYPEYESIKNLFFLRNNISHGKTHSEIDKKHIITGERSLIESVDKNYQKVRKYLIEKKVINDTEVSSNVNVLWKIKS